MTFANFLWTRLLIFLLFWLSMAIFMEAKIWAFLVASSHNPHDQDPTNYRHQSDVCHAYQLLKSRGIPEENIIVMMLDDIVNHPKNPTPGKIVYEPNGEDVYAGVQVDYRDHDANKENFFAVLLGDKSKVEGKGTGRVLESSNQDNVFLFVSGHGKVGSFEFQGKGGEEPITTKDLTETLKKMHDKGRYHKLVFYVELCYAASLFKTLPDNWNIYAVTASNDHEESKAGYCTDASFRPLCYTDMFTLNWITDSEENDLTTRSLDTQYKHVKKEYTDSEVAQFGAKGIAQEMVSEFLGSVNPSQQRSLPFSHKKLGKVMSPSEIQRINSEWHSENEKNATLKAELNHQHSIKEQHRLHVEKTLDILVARNLSVINEGDRSAPDTLPVHIDCHDVAVKTLFKHCSKWLSSDYVTPLINKVAELCRAGVSDIEIVRVIQEACLVD